MPTPRPESKPITRLIISLFVVWGGFHAIPVTVAAAGASPPPAPIARLKDLSLTTVLCERGRPRATIVIPDDAAYRALAAEINAQVRRCAGAELPVAVSGRPEDTLSRGPVIAIGNLANNPFIERLYFQWFCFTDRWYPGEGGYEVRSIHNPYGTGTNVILVGGSDERGAAEAVRKFCARLEPADPLSVGWLFDLRLGRNLAVPGDKGHSPSLLRLVTEGLEMPLGYNTASRPGLMYYYTGEARYAAAFIAAAREPGLLARADHYHAHHDALVWDLIEESPLFSDEDRLFVTNQLLEHARSGESGGGMDVLAGGAGRVFDRHAGFIGLCALADGRYLARDYPSPEWTRILAAVDAYFKPHLGSFASGSDLARGIYTYLEALLIYSLLTGNDEIAQSGALRAWADRCVAMCDPLGFLVPSGQYDEMSYPYFTLRKAAYLLKDPGLLYAAEMRGRAAETQGVFGLGMEYDQGQAFAGDLEPRPPEGLAGVHVVPLDSREREVFDPSLPQEKAFAKVTFRTGFGPDDQFLLLDGIWGGPPGKPIQDAGAILQFTDRGRTFIINADPETQNRRSSYVNHNVLTVTRNGEAPEPPRLAALEGVADLPSMGYTHTRLAPYMNGAWDRQILWKKGAYFLVRDVFKAARTGVFALESQWRLLGRVEIDEGGFAGTVGGPGLDETDEQRLVVRTAGGGAGQADRSGWPVRRSRLDISGEAVSRQYARYAPPAIGRLRPTSVLRLEEGDKAETCALLYTTSRERPRRHGIVPLGHGAYFIAGDEPAWAAFPEAGGEFVRGPLDAKARVVWMTAATAAAHGLTRLNFGGRSVLKAAKPVDAEWDMTRGTCTLKVTEPVSVELSGRGRVDLEPGEHRFSDMPAVETEALRRLAGTLAEDAAAPRPAPKILFDAALRPALSAPLLPAARDLLPGAEIHDLKIGGRGESAVVLAGCDDGRVVRMDSRGRVKWEFRTGGAVRAVAIAELSPRHWAALAGSDDESLYALDLESGKKIWSFRAGVFPETRIYPWWTLSGKAGVRSLLAADFDEDGRAEIAIGTGGMQVEMLASDGSTRWRQPVKYGLPARLLALRPPSGGPLRLLAGLDILASQSNLFSFLPNGTMESADAYPSGREGWDYTGISALESFETRDGRTVLAVGRSGAFNEVVFYDAASGRGLGKTRVGDTISGLIALEVDREPAVAAATEAGWILALKPDGQAGWSVPLPDAVIKLWAAGEGRVAAWCRNGETFILDSAGKIRARGQGPWPAAMLRTISD